MTDFLNIAAATPLLHLITVGTHDYYTGLQHSVDPLTFPVNTALYKYGFMHPDEMDVYVQMKEFSSLSTHMNTSITLKCDSCTISWKRLIYIPNGKTEALKLRGFGTVMQTEQIWHWFPNRKARKEESSFENGSFPLVNRFRSNAEHDDNKTHFFRQKSRHIKHAKLFMFLILHVKIHYDSACRDSFTSQWSFPLHAHYFSY